MKVFYDVSDRVVEFGSVRFYEHVQEHVSDILTECALEVTSGYMDNLYHLYQRYAMAYVLGSTARDVNVFIEYLAEEYDEGLDDSLVEESDTSALSLRQLGLHVDSRFPNVVHDMMPLLSETHRVIPGCDGDMAEHEKALKLAAMKFLSEHTLVGMETLREVSRTGLASVVASVCPGQYVEHYGDDFKGLVVVCEHETLL